MKQENNWNEIKTLYVSSDRYTLKELAEKFGVSLASIKRHSSQEKWGKERQRNIKQASEKIEKVQAQLVRTEQIEDFTYRDKVNEIARKLLDNIANAVDVYGKPANILALTTALKDLVVVMRDVNGEPNLVAQRTYELAKQKLVLDELRVNRGIGETGESGVVMLPEVKADE